MSKKNKHMTLDDRIEIQECLNKGMTFKAIGERIEKDPTTISKEVKLHGRSRANGFTKTDECCPRLMKTPFVCNGCSKRNHSNCCYPRRIYHAQNAQKEYEAVGMSSDGVPQRTVDDASKILIITEIEPLCGTQNNITRSIGIFNDKAYIFFCYSIQNFIEVVRQFLRRYPFHLLNRL